MDQHRIFGCNCAHIDGERSPRGTETPMIVEETIPWRNLAVKWTTSSSWSIDLEYL